MVISGFASRVTSWPKYTPISSTSTAAATSWPKYAPISSTSTWSVRTSPRVGHGQANFGYACRTGKPLPANRTWARATAISLPSTLREPPKECQGQSIKEQTYQRGPAAESNAAASPASFAFAGGRGLSIFSAQRPSRHTDAHHPAELTGGIVTRAVTNTFYSGSRRRRALPRLAMRSGGGEGSGGSADYEPFCAQAHSGPESAATGCFGSGIALGG